MPTWQNYKAIMSKEERKRYVNEELIDFPERLMVPPFIKCRLYAAITDIDAIYNETQRLSNHLSSISSRISVEADEMENSTESLQSVEVSDAQLPLNANIRHEAVSDPFCARDLRRISSVAIGDLRVKMSDSPPAERRRLCSSEVGIDQEMICAHSSDGLSAGGVEMDEGLCGRRIYVAGTEAVGSMPRSNVLILGLGGLDEGGGAACRGGVCVVG